MSPVLLHRLAATVALPLALTACSGDPITPPPLTPATSTTSSPTPTEQPETAEEFIRRWHELGNAMQLSGDTSAYRLLTSSCRSCEAFADTVDRIYKHGGYIDTNGERILHVTKFAHFTYDVRVESGPTTYKESSTASPTRLPGGSVTIRVQLQRDDNGWLVDDYSQLAGTAS